MIRTVDFVVATALTVYGIETLSHRILCVRLFFVATALTVYGIETIINNTNTPNKNKVVATALTVYGIETLLVHLLTKG